MTEQRDGSPDPGAPGKARRHTLEELLRDSDLPALSRLVWHVIAGYGTAKTGDVVKHPPSLAEIADGAGIGRRAAINHVNVLVKTGWLLRDSGGPGRKTRYRLSSPIDPSTPLEVVNVRAPSGPASESGFTKVVNPDSLHSERGCTTVVHGDAPYPGIQGSPSSPRPPAPELAAIRYGLTEDEAREFVTWIKTKRPDVGPGWFRTLADNGDLTDHIAAWREQRPRPRPQLAPWCGDCDPAGEHNPGARLIELTDDDGEITVTRCPRCHPANTGRTTP